MAKPFTDATGASSARIAHRLRAHAQLWRQVAVESRCGQTASEFARLADHCSRTANELEPAASATGSLRPH